VEIRDLIKDIGKKRTVVLSTHNLPEVQVTCNRVLIIAKGRIVADDTPDGLRARAGKAHFVVSVARKVDGQAVDPTKVRGALGKVSGVERIDAGPSGDADIVFHVVPKDGHDLRPAISKAAADEGLALVGLTRQEGDLESVFRQLTTDAGADAKATRHSTGRKDA
jgi:ABC-2 type transport system ATP-binding protein